MCFTTWVYSKLFGKCVGRDENNNLYYVSRTSNVKNRKRWVYYSFSDPETSIVPARWHGWLHYQTNIIPSQSGQKSAKHLPNMTGTSLAHFPPGFLKRRHSTLGDYQRWRPKSK